MIKSVTKNRYVFTLILMPLVMLCLNMHLSAQNRNEVTQKEISKVSAFNIRIDTINIIRDHGFTYLDVISGTGSVIFPKKEKTQRSPVTRVSTKRGDVDGDGRVNTNDLYLLVSFILEKNTESFLKENADMDGNGKIDINDVVIISVEMEK